MAIRQGLSEKVIFEPKPKKRGQPLCRSREQISEQRKHQVLSCLKRKSLKCLKSWALGEHREWRDKCVGWGGQQGPDYIGPSRLELGVWVLTSFCSCLWMSSIFCLFVHFPHELIIFIPSFSPSTTLALTLFNHLLPILYLGLWDLKHILILLALCSSSWRKQAVRMSPVNVHKHFI